MLLAGSWLIYDSGTLSSIGEGFAAVLIFTAIGFLITAYWAYRLTAKGNESKEARYYSDCSCCARVSENRADFRECAPDHDETETFPDSVILNKLGESPGRIGDSPPPETSAGERKFSGNDAGNDGRNNGRGNGDDPPFRIPEPLFIKPGEYRA